MNPDLQAFVRESLARGIPRATIAERLREAGWQPDEIEPALAAWAEAEFPIPIPRRRPYLLPFAHQPLRRAGASRSGVRRQPTVPQRRSGAWFP